MSLKDADSAKKRSSADNVTKGRKKFIRNGIAGFAVLLVILLTFWASSVSTTTGTTSRAGAKVQTPSYELTITPGGKSEFVMIPDGKRIQVSGDDFQPVYVYRDGGECSFNCPPYARKLYVRNLGKSWNTVTWKVVD